jgi:hypothetical protein
MISAEAVAVAASTIAAVNINFVIYSLCFLFNGGLAGFQTSACCRACDTAELQSVSRPTFTVTPMLESAGIAVVAIDFDWTPPPIGGNVTVRAWARKRGLTVRRTQVTGASIGG